MLFITRVALLKYRLQLPGFELPEPVRLAQREFDECLARTLAGMANRLQDPARLGTEHLATAFARLEGTVRACDSGGSQAALTSHLHTFLPLSDRITSLAVSLEKEL
jgi:multidrug resistance protein MdtO